MSENFRSLEMRTSFIVVMLLVSIICLVLVAIMVDGFLLLSRYHWGDLRRWLTRAGYVARVGEKINIHSVLVDTPEGKTPLERPRRGWGKIFQWTFKEEGGRM